MTRLEQIIQFKKQEVAKTRAEVAIKKLIESPLFKRKPLSLIESLSERNNNGIIGSFKRKTPNYTINEQASVKAVINDYLNANVAAISIFTDTKLFGGNMADFLEAKNIINYTKPVIRKDFIVDGFQIVESKAIGADAIVLMASFLTNQELKNYGKLAIDLGLEVIYEINSIEELDKLSNIDVKIVNVNNRDINHYKANLENAISIGKQIPEDWFKISEGAINSPNIVTGLKEYGYDGFCIGEHFITSDNPGKTCKDFINQLK